MFSSMANDVSSAPGAYGRHGRTKITDES